MKRTFKALAALLALALCMLPISLAEAVTPTEYVTIDNISDYFTDRDLSGEWDDDEAVEIALNDAGVTCDDASVTIDGTVITIHSEGTYVISGTLNNGSIIVDADDADKVQLILNGVELTATGTAAILVENADKVFVTLAPDTVNTLSVNGSFSEEDNVDAVVFSREDIVFNGTGTLVITCEEGNGIVSKDYLKFASGTYVVTVSNRAIDANDSIRIAGGSFTLISEKDAIRAKSDEEDEGYIIIFGGTFDITTGGGAANAPAHSNGMMGFGRQAGSATEGSSTSAKGIKASGNLVIAGGTFSIDASDDGLHTDGDLTIQDGSFTISSGDDGMHANGTLTINGGEIDITDSYEGIEGKCIVITDGIISVYASDDGLNAAGGSDSSGYGFYDMFASEDGVIIDISGGNLYVSAQGDGIDSNGDLSVSGGTIVVSGPTNSGDGALDYNGTASITGGTVIAAGASGMAENFGTASTQAAALVTLSGTAGTITVQDASGTTILSGYVEKNYDCVVISSPQLGVGATYTVSNDSASASVTLSSIITGSGTGMGMQGGGFGGMGGMGGNGGGRQRGGFGGNG